MTELLDLLRDNIPWLFSGLGVAVGGWLFRRAQVRWNEQHTLSGQSLTSQGTWLQIVREPVKPKSIVSRLPSFVLRLVFKPEQVASNVHIRLRENNPVALSLTPSVQVPCVDIYFEITNLNGIDLVLDRMLVDMWFGQPNFTGALLRRYAIPAGQITKNIYFRHELTSAQEAQIKRCRDEGVSYTLYLTGYFLSSAGMVEVKRRIPDA